LPEFPPVAPYDRTALLTLLSPNNSLTQNVPLWFLRVFGLHTWITYYFVTSQIYTDIAVRSMAYTHPEVSSGTDTCGVRVTTGPPINRYYNQLQVLAALHDHALWKGVGGVYTELGFEAVNLTPDSFYWVKCGALGTSIRSYETWMTFDGSIPAMAVAQITAVDASIASGRAGVRDYTRTHFPAGAADRQLFQVPDVPDIVSISSALPKVLAFLEMPVIGEGTLDSPFRAELPHDIRGNKDLLAWTCSNLIPSDNSGKPRHGTAIVTLLEMPYREPELAPIGKILEAARDMGGLRLKRKKAIDQALKMDDRLFIHDLVECKEHAADGKCFKEMMSWRIHNLGIPEELVLPENMQMYIKERKW